VSEIYDDEVNDSEVKITVIKKCPCRWLYPPQGWTHLTNCDTLRERKEMEEEWFGLPETKDTTE
jgi:hypothetical protein